MRPVRLPVALALALVACRGDDAPGPVAAPLVAEARDAGAPRDAAAPDAALPQACDDPCLFLRDTPLDQLGDVYAKTCGRALVPNNKDCGVLDYERNCIYAAHGMRFRSQKWSAYAKKPWYHLRPAFRSRELSALERANVHELWLRGKACRAHDVHVSTTDYARIQAWFAAYTRGTPTIPAIAISGEDRVAPDELGKTLVTLGLRLERGTWMAYHDPERAVTAALAGAKLRDVIVELTPRDGCSEDDGCAGPYVHFVFDEHDALAALVLTDH